MTPNNADDEKRLRQMINNVERAVSLGRLDRSAADEIVKDCRRKLAGNWTGAWHFMRQRISRRAVPENRQHDRQVTLGIDRGFLQGTQASRRHRARLGYEGAVCGLFATTREASTRSSTSSVRRAVPEMKMVK